MAAASRRPKLSDDSDSDSDENDNISALENIRYANEGDVKAFYNNFRALSSYLYEASRENHTVEN